MQSLLIGLCYQARNIRKHFQFHSHSLNAHRICFDSDIFSQYAMPLSENKAVNILPLKFFHFVSTSAQNWIL